MISENGNDTGFIPQHIVIDIKNNSRTLSRIYKQANIELRKEKLEKLNDYEKR